MTQIHSTALIDGFAMSAALIVAIGAQNMFVLRQGIRREHVGSIVLFCASADAMLIAAGVSGMGVLLGLMPGLALVLTLAGAVFLGAYGIFALQRAARPGALVAAEQGSMTLGRALASTAGFTLLNPHVYLDTVLLMGAVGSSRPLADRPLFVIGAAAASFLWFAGLGYGARLLAPVFARPAAWRVLDMLVGLTMFALAAGLVMRAASGA